MRKSGREKLFHAPTVHLFDYEQRLRRLLETVVLYDVISSVVSVSVECLISDEAMENNKKSMAFRKLGS